jgi:xanthine/uracil permease
MSIATCQSRTVKLRTVLLSFVLLLACLPKLVVLCRIVPTCVNRDMSILHYVPICAILISYRANLFDLVS